MAKKTCSDCVHCDVCENTFSWLDQEDNTKYITCHHFKNKADVVEVVRCKDCRMFVENKKAFVAYCKRELKNLCVKPDDYCSYGEKRSEEE